MSGGGDGVSDGGVRGGGAVKDGSVRGGGESGGGAAAPVPWSRIRDSSYWRKEVWQRRAGPAAGVWARRAGVHGWYGRAGGPVLWPGTDSVKSRCKFEGK
jgi:hypothetical protein